KVFDWRILEKYNLSKPFFLSGGIGVENIDDILKISHPLLFAIDVNSKFEIEPGLKDLNKSRQVINKLKSKEFN
ncbi:MAG: phosphoribosylanthranilate isomerase, partial [Chitinophagales bacterium]|nr:phosphoribosylanthranilate isomerase [Chitinophagales bacterium]